MPNPQQPELRRSGRTVLEPDSIGSDLPAEKGPEVSGRNAPVPEANAPGHHPEHEQDKPDPAAFAERLGIDPD